MKNDNDKELSRNSTNNLEGDELSTLRPESTVSCLSVAEEVDGSSKTNFSNPIHFTPYDGPNSYEISSTKNNYIKTDANWSPKDSVNNITLMSNQIENPDAVENNK